MTCRLIRITSNDYRDYCDVYQKTEYSFFENGKGLPPLALMLMRLTAISHTFSEKEFLEAINDPNQEMYFFETNGKINGFFYVVYKPMFCCDIVEFTVHDKGKGLGRIYFQEALKLFKERKVSCVRLQCPDELKGAQAFWRKMGFEPKILSNKKHFELKVKYKK